jgi:pSer/pThr/pTyr-binding forkhead associated (FHA) protein
VSVDPTFGEFEEELREEDEARRRKKELDLSGIPRSAPKSSDVEIIARLLIDDDTRETHLQFSPGGKRLSVGRGTDNDLCITHSSVSKIHSSMMMNREGTLLLADAGSTNGTFINGRRIAYGEARQIEEGDVVGFGEVEVRFRRV